MTSPPRNRPNDEWQAQNLTLMREAHQRASVLPRRLVEARVLATSRCEMLWREARPASDFPAVRAALEEVFALTTGRCENIGGDAGSLAL